MAHIIFRKPKLICGNISHLSKDNKLVRVTENLPQGDIRTPFVLYEGYGNWTKQHNNFLYAILSCMGTQMTPTLTYKQKLIRILKV